MEVVSTYIDNIQIEGYRGDYILETIEKTGDFYESIILNKWSPIIGKPNIIFDIGSNIGNHSIYWATRLCPSAIYAFEPYPDNFSRLKNNVTNNNLNTIITPIKKGVGDHLGYASISNIDETNLGGTSIVYTNDKQESTIQITDLDSFSKENDINTVDFIKIDTEGFELLVLQGMQDLIMKYHPDIWVEVSHSTYLEVIEALQKEGYVLHDIEQFNLLFLHPIRHDTVNRVDPSKILEGFFKYLEKTNQYYKNYNTAKKWLEERNRTLEQLKISHQNKIEELKSEYEQKIKACQLQYEEKYHKKVEEFESELKAAKDLQDKMSKFLIEDVKLFDDQVNAMESIKQYVRKLQTQNSYLSAENQEYRRKFAKITGTWYGRILVKLYKFLQRLKRRIKGQK